MVRLPDPGELRPETEVGHGAKRPLAAAAVKLEAEDPLEERQGPANKIPKCSASFPQVCPRQLCVRPRFLFDGFNA